eukprot:8106778-Pyramimonas_sp.AAC.1
MPRENWALKSLIAQMTTGLPPSPPHLLNSAPRQSIQLNLICRPITESANWQNVHRLLIMYPVCPPKNPVDKTRRWMKKATA